MVNTIRCTIFRLQDIRLYLCICTSRVLNINTSQCTRFHLQSILLYLCICTNRALHINTIQCTRFRLLDTHLCCLDCVFIFVFVWTSVYWSEHQPRHHQPVHHIPSSRHRCICEFVWTENYTYQPGQHHPVHQIPSSRHPSVLSGLSAGTRSSLSSSSLGGKQDGNGWWWRFTMADPSSIWLTTL